MKEFDLVVLVDDVPDFGLVKGDVGTIVMEHDNGKAFEVEFATLAGDTIGVITLPVSVLHAAGSSQILHVRDFPEMPQRKSA